MDASRRHINSIVSSTGGVDYFIKQGVDIESSKAIRHEFFVYDYLQTAGLKPKIDKYLPKMKWYDPAINLMVLECIIPSQNYREYHARRGTFPKIVAKALGKALATIHQATSKKATWPSIFQNTKPNWGLSIHCPPIELILKASVQQIELVKILQRYPELARHLDDLRWRWQGQSVIHGDLRWDNVLIRRDKNGRIGVNIIDWEASSLGDCRWDVGCIIGEYLACWLNSMTLVDDTITDDVIASAKYPIEKIQPAIHTFWETYAGNLQLDEVVRIEWLADSIRYAAVRLIQIAFEQSRITKQLTRRTVCCLQFSLNILKHPHEALAQLIGFPPVD